MSFAKGNLANFFMFFENVQNDDDDNHLDSGDAGLEEPDGC